jgi:hypothetical protein
MEINSSPPPAYNTNTTTQTQFTTYPPLRAAHEEREGEKAPAYFEAQLPVRYIEASCSQSTTYLLRSDGIVDRIASRGNVHLQMIPPKGTTYTAVSAGQHASYLLRSDGVAIRTTTSGRVNGIAAERRPPPGLQYTAISSGTSESLLLRSDGVVERALYGGAIASQITPPPGLRYTSVSVGLWVFYLLRSDGKIERYTNGTLANIMDPTASSNRTPSASTSTGKKMLHPALPGITGGDLRYVAISPQLTVSNDKCSYSSYAKYFVLSNGTIHRSITKGKVKRQMQPSQGASYVAAAAGDHASYLLKGDGTVDRITTMGKVHSTMAASSPYVQVSAGQHASYLVRADGKVDRTVSGGRIQKSLSPESPAEFAARRKHEAFFYPVKMWWRSLKRSGRGSTGAESGSSIVKEKQIMLSEADAASWVD